VKNFTSDDGFRIWVEPEAVVAVEQLENDGAVCRTAIYLRGGHQLVLAESLEAVLKGLALGYLLEETKTAAVP